MQSLVFSPACIFHLQKLEAEYRKRLGERFRLSEESERLRLIQQSSESPNKIIQKYFRKFAHELEPELVNELITRGIVRPGVWH